jgi:RimJ/RimL family protein N-acetyltransferase
MQQTIHPGVKVPVIETERLRLRAHRLDDFAASAEMWSDPIVIRHTTGKPQTPEEVWARLLRYIGHWAMLGYGFWALEEKASGEFVGEIGFADFKRIIEPSLDGMPEIGWVLVSRFHGKGYATEGVRAVIAWGDEHFGATKTVCLIQPENLASIRVAEKFGYREYARSTYKEHAVIMLSREGQ